MLSSPHQPQETTIPFDGTRFPTGGSPPRRRPVLRECLINAVIALLALGVIAFPISLVALVDTCRALGL